MLVRASLHRRLKKWTVDIALRRCHRGSHVSRKVAVPLLLTGLPLAAHIASSLASRRVHV